jgi:benzodiazapine receptor
MKEQDRPGMVRLLLYMILSAGLSGGLAGWIYAGETIDWVTGLDFPVWVPEQSIMTGIWIFLFQLVAMSLWLVQRSGRDGMRTIASILIIGLFVAIFARIYIYFGIRDVTMGFALSLANWIYALFAVAFVGRANSPAGYLLWPLFVWQTFGLALCFEIMRLNTGTIGVGNF